MNSPQRSVCLQINLHPRDATIAVHMLPHHLRVLGGQVDEVLLTVDLQHRKGSRYRSEDFEAERARLQQILDRVCAGEPKARVVTVDYAAAARERVAREFMGGPYVPLQAYYGGPYYPYLYGLHAARADHVLHLDSDMLLGGGSQTWVREALALLARDRSVIACNPLPGPPTADGRLRTQQAERVEAPYPAWRFRSLSTRVFLLDKRRFLSGELRVPLLRPAWPKRVGAWIQYTEPYIALEDSLSAFMRACGLSRIDFLGEGGGLWTLHPVYRCPRFYRELPNLIARVESGDVPEGQRGDYDLNDAMFDWSEARAARTLARRAQRRLEYALSGMTQRLALLGGSPRGGA